MTFRRMKVLSKSSRKHDTTIILSEHLSFPSHSVAFLSGFYVKGALEILDNVIEMPKTFHFVLDLYLNKNFDAKNIKNLERHLITSFSEGLVDFDQPIMRL